MTERGQELVTGDARSRPGTRRLARWFGSRRGRAVTGTVLLLAGTMPVLGSSGSSAGAAPPTEPNLVCPPAATPPPYYGVQFSGNLVERSPIAVTTPGGLVLTIPGFTATVCGLINFVPGSTPVLEGTIVHPDGIDLDIGNTATLGQAILPVSVAPDGDTTGTVVSSNPPIPVDQGLTLIIHAPVANSTQQLGVTCTSHVDVTLKTFPGGTPLQGALKKATADLTVAISIPTNSTAVSSNCPSYLANQIDGLITMPLTPTPAIVHANLDVCTRPVTPGPCPFPAPEP